MSIASRQSLWISSSPTAKNYVQDGLVAMWDGIENAGWKTHRSNLPVDLIGGIGNFSLARASATVDEKSVVFASSGRIVTPSYQIGNRVLTMQMCALRSGGSSLGELGVLWENPWFGINLRPQGPGVRFTCGQDIDFLTDITKAETYTLVRDTTQCKFYKGTMLLGQQNISITSFATKQLAAGNW